MGRAPTVIGWRLWVQVPILRSLVIQIQHVDACVDCRVRNLMVEEPYLKEVE